MKRIKITDMVWLLLELPFLRYYRARAIRAARKHELAGNSKASIEAWRTAAHWLRRYDMNVVNFSLGVQSFNPPVEIDEQRQMVSVTEVRERIQAPQREEDCEIEGDKQQVLEILANDPDCWFPALCTIWECGPNFWLVWIELEVQEEGRAAA